MICRQQKCLFRAGLGRGSEEQVGRKTFLCMIYRYQRRKDFLPTCCVRDFEPKNRQWEGGRKGKGGRERFSRFCSALKEAAGGEHEVNPAADPAGRGAR